MCGDQIGETLQPPLTPWVFLVRLHLSLFLNPPWTHDNGCSSHTAFGARKVETRVDWHHSNQRHPSSTTIRPRPKMP